MNFPADHIEPIGISVTPNRGPFFLSRRHPLGLLHPSAFPHLSGTAYRGKRPTSFAQKALRLGHASMRDYMGTGSLFHLFSRTSTGRSKRITFATATALIRFRALPARASRLHSRQSGLQVPRNRAGQGPSFLRRTSASRKTLYQPRCMRAAPIARPPSAISSISFRCFSLRPSQVLLPCGHPELRGFRL